MCGLVFVANHKGTLFEKGVMNRAFRTLLILDTIRGAHSTGFFAVDKDGGTADWVKAAVDGYRFNQLDAVKKQLGQGYKYNCLVGHNRYATAGAVTNDNAHPFAHGDITGVHNGGVHNRTLLEGDPKLLPVDSSQLYYHLHKKGTEDLIKNLNANYALIWHNAKTDTVHFLRNWSTSERPFWFVKFTNGYWMGASEKAMLEVVINRENGLKNSPHEFIELPRGEEWVFDVKGGNFELKEQIKRPMPSFRTVVYYTPSKKQTKKNNAKANKRANGLNDIAFNNIIRKVLPDMKVGDTVNFYPIDIKRYDKDKSRGCLEGMLDIVDIDVKVYCHGADFELADEFVDSEYVWTGKIRSAYLSGKTGEQTLNLMLENVVPTDPAYTGTVEYDEGHAVIQTKTTSDGTSYTKADWSKVGYCAYCGDNLPGFDSKNVEACDTITVAWVLCPSCARKSIGEI